MLLTKSGSTGQISIHAPRGGSDAVDTIQCAIINNFNPRSPWGERLRRNRHTGNKPVISIHAPRGGSDVDWVWLVTASIYFNPRSPWGERPVLPEDRDFALVFQSTLPVGGATLLRMRTVRASNISIHAPRGGSDFAACNKAPDLLYFNPRSPWGERPLLRRLKDVDPQFQSTLPVGGATAIISPVYLIILISIHAPRGGSDF